MSESEWISPEERDHWGYGDPEAAEGGLEALHRYRTWAGESDAGVQDLLDRIAVLTADEGPHRRREELVGRAVAGKRVGRKVAEQAYDIALEEDLEPAYGVELVRARIGVLPLSDPEPEAPATQPSRPDWIEDAPPPTEAQKERAMRETFRRLRALLEKHGDPRAAFRALLSEEDVGGFKY